MVICNAYTVHLVLASKVMASMPTTRKRNELGSSKWKKLRIEILVRDGYICHLCGGDGADTVDHLIARVHGGDIWDRENLAAAHKGCNSSKGAKPFFSAKSLDRPTEKARRGQT